MKLYYMQKNVENNLLAKNGWKLQPNKWTCKHVVMVKENVVMVIENEYA